MKLIIGFLLFGSLQVFSQSYLNVLFTNDSYKNSQISELKKITFSGSGDLIYFHLSDQSVVSENTAEIKSILLGNTPLGSALPVELSAFSAVQTGVSVLLNWRTETETNNYGFDIERSKETNGFIQKWNKIGFVEGQGNSNVSKNYSFTDNPGTGSKYYYRLRQIDSDGQFKYSDVISIDLKMPDRFMLFQNYPNPFNPTTSITYNLPDNEFVLIKIFDVLGNEVTTLVNDHQKAGSYTVKFDGSRYASGIYILCFKSGSYNSNIKMILMK
jgi:hypothetical protein